MYRSPIEILCADIWDQIQTQIDKQQGEDIYKAVVRYGINVDKEELIRALKYDRNQYEKGYMDGRADARKEIVRCKDCKHRTLDFFGGHCCKLHKGLAMVTDESFCSYGERRCDNEVDCVNTCPTIEAEPVVHGRWEQCFEDWRKQIEGDKCSACGFEHYGCSVKHYHYCPNCGAKMDGRSEGE